MLEKSFNEEELEFSGRVKLLQDKRIFKDLLIEASKKNWVIYSNNHFAGAEQVINLVGS